MAREPAVYRSQKEKGTAREPQAAVCAGGAGGQPAPTHAEDADGELRTTVLDVEARLRREAADHLDALAMSPRSRSRLGADLVRATVSAVDAAEAQAARERLDARMARLHAADGSAEEMTDDG